MVILAQTHSDGLALKGWHSWSIYDGVLEDGVGMGIPLRADENSLSGL